MTANILTVDNLTVTYAGIIRAVRGVSFAVRPGECLALVGESGCGKTSIARAVMGLLPPGARMDGSIRLLDRQIVGAGENTLRSLRGLAAGFVGQDPFQSYDPLKSIRTQLADAWHIHGGSANDNMLADRLTALGIVDASVAMRHYPHEWSGGMLQRASIVAAAAHHPPLIVADEPTSALDADRADATLEALKGQGAAILLVSHDMRLVERHADTVAVCYAGRIVETGPADRVSRTPRHPYTKGLIAALPRHKGQLPEPMAGSAPPLHLPDEGCSFAERCGRATASCHTEIPALQQGVACLNTDPPPLSSPQPQPAISAGEAPRNPLLAVSGAARHYGHGRQRIEAVRRADLTVFAGEILGICGSSGCGKSTLLRLIAGMERPDHGEIRLLSQDAQGRRAGIVMPIFQNPLASLDHRWPIWKSVAEPATAPHRPRLSKAALRELALAKLADVGLSHIDPEARPGELSGGQCQRVSIARALAAEPALLIADEPTSALDASVSATIIRLLHDLARRGTTIVIVSHDRSLLDALCDRVLEMQGGVICDAESRTNFAMEEAAE